MPLRPRPVAGAAVAALALSLATGTTPAAAAAVLLEPAVSATVPLLPGLYEDSVDPLTGEVWVAAAGAGRNPAASYVVAVDTRTREVVKTVDVTGNAAYGLKVNPVTGTVYTTNTRTSSVSVIDAASGTLVKSIPLSRMLREVELDLEQDLVYVPEPNDGSIALIDGATETLTKTFEGVAAAPFDVQAGVAKHVIYVADFGSGTVVKYDTRRQRVLATITVGLRPENLSYDPATRMLFVTNFGDGTVSVIDTRTDTVTATVATGAGALSVEVDPVAHLAYVTNRSEGTVTLLDSATGEIVGETAVDPLPNTVMPDVLTGTAWVTTKGKDTLQSIDTPHGPRTLREQTALLRAGLAVYGADGNVHAAVKDLDRALAAPVWTAGGTVADQRLFERYVSRAAAELQATDADAAAAAVLALLG